MPAVNIDRLTLKLSGLSEEEARRLVRLVTQGLAESPLRAAGGKRPAVESNQQMSAGTSVEELSKRIVMDLLNQLG
jgi:hypothetical protein